MLCVFRGSQKFVNHVTSKFHAVSVFYFSVLYNCTKFEEYAEFHGSYKLACVLISLSTIRP
jgi:hypothetical protein